MPFSDYLNAYFAAHRAIEAQDVVKLCYQAAYGSEHLLHSAALAEARLRREMAETPAADVPLYECVSERVCRVSLAAWKHHGLPVSWLFRLFAASCRPNGAGETAFAEALACAGALIDAGACCVTEEQWRAYLAAYRGGAVHHSETLRRAEHPAYRIVECRYLPLLPILVRAAALPDGAVRVIAVDGRAGAGKSTLSALLAPILCADVIHMDDFFLPLPLRTPERMAECGGNVDYDRFAAEVLPGIKRAEDFSYRVFDCACMDFCGTRTVASAPWRIVEGSYALHPRFGDYADVSVFVTVPPDEQLRRIRARNGAEMAQRFASLWIPMEERYFAGTSAAARADVCLDAPKLL